MRASSSLNSDDSAKEESDVHKKPININAILPPELLINIFDILYQDITDSLPFPFPYDQVLEHFRRHPLLDLMLVQRGWCNLVQTTPSYWTHVNIGVTDIITRGSRGASRDGMPSIGKGEVKELQEQLEKSGSLPLHLTIAPGLILDFSIVPHVLKEHASRLETLNILPNAGSKAGPIRDTSLEYLVQLLKLPLSSLKRLQMDKLSVTPHTPETDLTLRIDLDAPNLRQLSSHSHLIVPQNPSHLTFLSVSKLDLRSIKPPFDGSQIELPQLLELRIRDCEPGPILSAFSTPTLEVLVFRSKDRPIDPPVELPQYSHLRDLQWSDRGPDPVSRIVFQRCPNLTRYTNYVVGQETEVDIQVLINGASILEAGGNPTIWPKLEEVMLDCAMCANLSALVDAVPTIRRIRLLRDPIDSPIPHNQNLEREKEILVELWRKVDLVLWLDPWTDA